MWKADAATRNSVKEGQATGAQGQARQAVPPVTICALMSDANREYWELDTDKLCGDIAQLEPLTRLPPLEQATVAEANPEQAIVAEVNLQQANVDDANLEEGEVDAGKEHNLNHPPGEAWMGYRNDEALGQSSLLAGETAVNEIGEVNLPLAVADEVIESREVNLVEAGGAGPSGGLDLNVSSVEAWPRYLISHVDETDLGYTVYLEASVEAWPGYVISRVDETDLDYTVYLEVIDGIMPSGRPRIYVHGGKARIEAQFRFCSSCKDFYLENEIQVESWLHVPADVLTETINLLAIDEKTIRVHMLKKVACS